MARSNTLTISEIQSLVDKHVKDSLSIMEELTVTSPRTSWEKAQRDSEALDIHRDDLADALTERRWGAVDHVVDDLLEGREVDRESRNRLARELLRVILPLTDVQIAYTQGDYEAQYHAPKSMANVIQQSMAAPIAAPAAVQAAPMAVPAAPPSVTLAELISRYNAENEDRWSVSTWNNYQGLAKVMRQLIGANVPVKTIDRTVFRIYRDALRRLPKRFSNHPDFESMTSHKVLEMDRPDTTIEPKVVNKYISYASSLFKWARIMDYMGDNPAEGMRVPVEDKETAMFEDADLLKLFGCPDYAPKYPSQFWVPLMGLYTGARLNEICQLHVKDVIKEVDDEGPLWWISINDEAPDKNVKTKNARRIVPIHPVLVRLGFIEYVEGLAPEGRVFPDLTFSKHRQNYTDRVSKWFNRLLDRLNIKPTEELQREQGLPNKTFHTFRHTNITALLRANVAHVMVAAVVGHDKQMGITGNYHHGYLPRQLYNDVVTQLDYAVDVFDLLKGHKYAGGGAEV